LRQKAFLRFFHGKKQFFPQKDLAFYGVQRPPFPRFAFVAMFWGILPCCGRNRWRTRRESGEAPRHRITDNGWKVSAGAQHTTCSGIENRRINRRKKNAGVRASSSLAGRGFPSEKGMEKGVKLPYDFGK